MLTARDLAACLLDRGPFECPSVIGLLFRQCNDPVREIWANPPVMFQSLGRWEGAAKGSLLDLGKTDLLWALLRPRG
jgi:hypothetical protein